LQRAILYTCLAGLLAAGVLLLLGPAWPVAGAGRPVTPPLFGPNVRANSDTTTYGQHEPSLAVSRVHTTTVVVAAKDYRNNDQKEVWIDVSTDGGATWPVGRQLQMPGVNATLFPNESDAVVQARNDGRIYVACLGYNNSNAVFITWTDDDGATWHNPSVQISPTDSSLDDKDWFAIDNTPSSPYYHDMYMMYAPGAGYVAEQHSTDGGLTWTPRQAIGSSNTEYSYPVIASDGTVYNFMMDNWGAGRTGTIELTKSTNGGTTWSTPTTVASVQQPNSPIRSSDQFRFFAITSAVVDPNNGNLYIAWTDNRNYNTNGTDVLYVKSTDGGTSWTAPIRLSHDPTGVVRDHITPMLAVGADSRLHAFWLDRRLDPNNHLFDSWYSSSTDGGATWDPDSRVSTVSQDLNIGFPPGSGNAAGDYWGLDTARDTVYTAWNDTRDGVQQDIYVAKGLLYPLSGSTATPTPPPPSATAAATAAVTASATPVATATATGLPTAPATLPPTGSAVPTTTPPAGSPTATATPSGPPPTGTATRTATALVSPTETITPCATGFTDVHPTDYFYAPVLYLTCHGVISGYGDGTFRPYNQTTRAQMVKIVVLGFGTPLVTPPGGGYTFADVLPSFPFWRVIETAAVHQIVSGYTCGGPGEPCDSAQRPYFRPYTNVTRGQLAKITVVAAGWATVNPPAGTFADVLPGTAFYLFVETAACHGIVSGYSCGGPGEPCDSGGRPYFRQYTPATRGQIAKIAYGAITGPPACTAAAGPP